MLSEYVRSMSASVWLGYKLVNLQRVATIEHEHRIFSTFVNASIFPEESDTVVSSLVIGEDVVHSYHFRYHRDEKHQTDIAVFLILITYSRHVNTRFLKPHTLVDIIGATLGYLTVSRTS